MPAPEDLPPASPSTPKGSSSDPSPHAGALISPGVMQSGARMGVHKGKGRRGRGEEEGRRPRIVSHTCIYTHTYM